MELTKELKTATLTRLQEIFPDSDMGVWHIDIMSPDDIIQCERYGLTSVYFNFLPNGKYEVEIFCPQDTNILTYTFDETSIAAMFYESHCNHLKAIRDYISENI